MVVARTQPVKRQGLRLVVFAVLAGVVYVVSIPSGFGPLLVGLAVLGGGVWARHRDPGLARLAQLVGIAMTVGGLALLAGIATTGGGGSDRAPAPQEQPVQRP